MNLAKRDYQLEADAAVLAHRERGVQTQLVVLPTGCGKTVVLSGLPGVLGLRPPDVTLIVAHRDELIEQTVTKVKAVDPSCWVEVEKAERVAGAMAHVVVASVQTLQGARVDRFFQRFHGRIKLFIIDEAHHATAQSYMRLVQRVLAESPDATVVGFTATPQRADKLGLGHVFQEIAYSKSIRWAIDSGYLVPVSCYRVSTKTDLRAVTTRAGDFAQNELSDAVNNDGRNDQIVSAYLQHTPGKKAIAFTVSVEHARTLAQFFVAAGVKAAFASGETPKEQRREILAAFKSGQIDVLCNCALYTEGFDEPSAAVMIGARPTKSSSLYTQMAGRVLRPIDDIARLLGPGTTDAERTAIIAASSKPEAIILDIVDQARKHTLQTFPGLWGLPPSLNAQGQRIDRVAKKWDELTRREPAVARREIEQEDGLSFEQIATIVEKVDPFKIPAPDPYASQYSELTWNLVETDTYRLGLPARTIAKHNDGSDVTDWWSRKKNAERELQERGIRNPSDAALYYQMGVDPSSVSTIREEITLQYDALGKAEVVLEKLSTTEPGRDQRVIGTAADLPEAFKVAESWIAINRPEARRVVAKNAPWKLKPATEGQTRLLTRLGVPRDRMPATMGDATAMIDHLLKSKRKRAS